MIFLFLQDTLALNQVNTCAAQPINFSNTSDVKLMLTLDQAKLTMLEPIILQKMHAIEHEFTSPL
jgi:hypothetical protein